MLRGVGWISLDVGKGIPGMHQVIDLDGVVENSFDDFADPKIFAKLKVPNETEQIMIELVGYRCPLYIYIYIYIYIHTYKKGC